MNGCHLALGRHQQTDPIQRVHASGLNQIHGKFVLGPRSSFGAGDGVFGHAQVVKNQADVCGSSEPFSARCWFFRRRSDEARRERSDGGLLDGGFGKAI
jgi:hypothetical protein